MAVEASRENDTLILKIDSFDLKKMDEAIKLWNFKDEQSFLRFTVSLLIVTENKSLWMQEYGHQLQIIPAKHSLKS
jgi:hypothetical protein